LSLPADRPAPYHPQENWLEPPPQPPDAGSEAPLPQQFEANVEKTFLRLAFPHFGHFSAFSAPVSPAA
jgi:hypothetical protein